MGNWRRVQIVGTCGSQDVAALKAAITVDRDYTNFYCLSHTSGICGLPMWASTEINAVGNLAERGYDAESIAEALEEIAQKVPSLAVKVHVGNDYEADDCIATVQLVNGETTVLDPEVQTIPELSKSQMNTNLMSQLMRG